MMGASGPGFAMDPEQNRPEEEVAEDNNTNDHDEVDAKSSEPQNSTCEAGSSPCKKDPKESIELKDSKETTENETTTVDDNEKDSSNSGGKCDEKDKDKEPSTAETDSATPTSSDSQQQPSETSENSEAATDDGKQADPAKSSETVDGDEDKKTLSEGEREKPDKENKPNRRNRSNRRGRRLGSKSNGRRASTSGDDGQKSDGAPRRRRNRSRRRNRTNSYLDPNTYANGYSQGYRPRGRGRLEGRITYVNNGGLPSPPYKRNFGSSSFSNDNNANYRHNNSEYNEGHVRDRPGFYAARIVRPTNKNNPQKASDEANKAGTSPQANSSEVTTQGSTNDENTKTRNRSRNKRRNRRTGRNRTRSGSQRGYVNDNGQQMSVSHDDQPNGKGRRYNDNYNNYNNYNNYRSQGVYGRGYQGGYGYYTPQYPPQRGYGYGGGGYYNNGYYGYDRYYSSNNYYRPRNTNNNRNYQRNYRGGYRPRKRTQTLQSQSSVKSSKGANNQPAEGPVDQEQVTA